MSKILKPFKSWIVWDASGIYSPTMHITRYEAQFERNNNDMRDAKWRIARVEVRPVKP